MFHKVKSATPREPFQLLVHFSDGSARLYNVAPLFAKWPAFRALEQVDGLFQQVDVDAGGYGVSWNDDLDLSSNELWEHGAPVETPFSQLLAFGDATELWGLSESTLRKAVAYGKLVEGVDVKKFGKQWVVTSQAMTREYGPAPTPK